MKKSNDFLVVIPARMGSTRFPGKVLAPLNGKPIVEWCRQAALRAGIGPVVVATESVEVVKKLEPYGADVVLTSRRCASGTDRVWEAAQKRGSPAARFVMNLQGDEPLIRPGTIRAVADILRKTRDADMATAVVALRDAASAENPNIVKAVLTAGGRCLYFSRSAIPYMKPEAPTGTMRSAQHPRKQLRPSKAGRMPLSGPAGSTTFPAAQNGLPGCWKHIGIYGYRRDALKRFVNLKQSALERREGLEQLRALEAGMSVMAAIVDDPAVAIDTPQDLESARRQLNRSDAASESFPSLRPQAEIPATNMPQLPRERKYSWPVVCAGDRERGRAPCSRPLPLREGKRRGPGAHSNG